MMNRQKESRMRRKGQILAFLLVAIAASIALITTTSGNAGSKASTGPSGYVGKGGGIVGKGGGFGETYKAPSATLAHTLFKATLLPSNKTARNITLAAFGRSPRPVNYTLRSSAGRTTAVAPEPAAS
jgi:hypothetical protein